MKINGYWFGAGMIMLIDYIWFMFVSTDMVYFDLIIGLNMFLLIIFFGLAFKQKLGIK